MADKLVPFCEIWEFFVISDLSLDYEACLEEAPLLTRIFFTVLFEVEEMIEEREMTGPFALLSLLGIYNFAFVVVGTDFCSS